MNSSLTILSGSLQSNQIYQFMVQMTNIRNASLQATGYVLVKIEVTRPKMIAIGCVIITMCSPNLEYQFVNPTTQVALFSIPIGNYSAIQNITWNIYSGQIINSSSSYQWILFNQTKNSWFFGKNTSNFTAMNQLFLQYPSIQVWRFEVVYSFLTEISTSALNFIINQPPQNGSCSISPSNNGTTSTLFTILCSNWYDEDEIKDYSVYIWTIENPNKILIAFSMISTLQIRLPAGDVYLVIVIRDQLNSITEYNISSSSIIVQADLNAIDDFITNSRSSSNELVRLLASENQNIVSQLIVSLSQQFNQRNVDNIQRAISNGISYTNISISPLNTQPSSQTGEFNQSALIEYQKELNVLANIREYLISFTRNLFITTSSSIQLQSISLVQLTKATNQLTRNTISIAADTCYRLTNALYSISTRISYEDLQISATALLQCASNLISAVNGPLQGRTMILDLDAQRAAALPSDYDTDLEFQWSKINYQQQLANQIQNQMNEIISKLTSALRIHLNIGQHFQLNTSEVFFSLSSQTQIMIQPLAPFGNSPSTNLSRSILQQNITEIFIQRDPNMIIPSMILQNVTSTDFYPHQQLFHLHYVNLTTSLSISIHIEIEPLNFNISYLFIYKFDRIPQLNSSINQIDGWTILNSSNFNYFLDNEQTRNHHSFVFGLRELNSTESSLSNLPITNEKYNFTSNYKLQVYSSGCYYLDENNQWKDDGLRVGPLTNHNQTQCFS